VHPKIDSISASEGYQTGGQSLTIQGFGLLGASSTVFIDGVDCIVNILTSTDEILICETGSKSTPSILGPQPGQPGATFTFVNPNIADEIYGTEPNAYTLVSWAQMTYNTLPKKVTLASSLESIWGATD
jgi:hypothetical protein